MCMFPTMRHLVSAFSLSLFFPALICAADYYVSPAGNDANDGDTAATAWQSVRRVNLVEFQAGDTVRFECGGVWTEPLKPGRGGSREAPLVITSYGNGPKPLFKGCDELALKSGRAAVSGQVSAAMLNGHFLPQSDWEVEDGIFRLRQPVSPTDKIEAVTRDDMVYLLNVQHIILRGLAVDGTAKMHAGYGFRLSGCEGILLEDCTATRCGKHHYGVINSTEVTIRRCHASMVMPDQGTGGASAFVSYSDSSRKGDTSHYENCVVEDYANTGKGRYPAFVSHGEGIGEIRITGMKSRGAAININNRESGAFISVSGCEVEDAGIGLFGNKCLLEHSTITRGVLTLYGEENAISDCSVVGLNPGFAGHQSAVVNTGRNNSLHRCTIRLSEAARPMNAALALVAPASALTWTDCIFGEHGAAVRLFFADPSQAGCIAKGNLYPSQARFIIQGLKTPLNLAQWQELGFDQ